MRLRKLLAVASVAAVAAVGLVACGSSDDASSITDKDSLKIGVKFDQPGLGLKTESGAMEGFGIDVATYIAKELGVSDDNIEWVETPSAQRETALQNKEVDLIIATYSITDKRKEVVDFAGPYFVAHQDLLVRADSDISSADDLSGKLLCSVTGSTSAQNVKDIYPDVQLKEYGGYSDCLQALSSGAIDALTTDNIILAGYAAQQPGEFRLVGEPFSDENYGVGIWKGDSKAQEAINAAITKMQDDGSWEAFMKKNFGDDFVIPERPAITEK